MSQQISNLVRAQAAFCDPHDGLRQDGNRRTEA